MTEEVQEKKGSLAKFIAISGFVLLVLCFMRRVHTDSIKNPGAKRASVENPGLTCYGQEGYQDMCVPYTNPDVTAIAISPSGAFAATTSSMSVSYVGEFRR